MCAQLFLNFISADSSMGKVDKFSLSQQTLMELLIEGFTTNKERICGDINEPKDISEWPDVDLNDSNEVIEIDWSYELLQGSVELKWLPLTTKQFNIAENDLSGTIDLTSLPDCLETLSLGGNTFSGTIDLAQLPSGLVRLSLCDNDFYGLTDFSRLPGSLKKLDIENLKVEGQVCDFEGDLFMHGSKVKDLRKNCI